MAYEFEEELEIHPEHEHEHEHEEEMEEEMEHEAGLEGEGWLGAIGNVVGSLLGEEEMEHEHEHEFEHERELNPMRKIYPDAMMEHLGELAAGAETEDEAAEHFLPLIGMAASKLLPVVARAAAPLARKLLPKIARAVTKAAPRLTKGIGQVARTLHRNPQTRHLLKTVPTIARRTVGSLAHQAARGRVVTPRVAVRTLARQTRRVLTHPRHRALALRRHNRLERRFHRAYGPGMARPHWRWGRGRRYGRYPYGYWQGRGPQGATRGYAGPGYATPGQPGVPYQAGAPVAGAAPVRYGRVVGGQCTCSPCPACGTPAGGQAAAPQYCRCCGQVLR
jgi:hypothetical protein